MQVLATTRIGIVGLGYVGLPLATEFAKHFPVVGFDQSPARIAELTDGHDHTLEVSEESLRAAKSLTFSSDPRDLSKCNVFIVAVPTPVDNAQRPNFGPLISASETVGRVMGREAIIVYESTVYPGATEEVCVPILARESGLTFNQDFFAGYSPERVNPGDKQHRLPTIKKITSGSTREAARFVDELYRTIITAGTHPVSSIRVAEATKVIENTQRDLNIALMNELSLICGLLEIDTTEVLEAAGTKWNFLPFRPGLVGGHCIGVDPYYLTYKAQQLGYHPEVILAGRRINDSMASHVAGEVVKLLARKRLPVAGARILVLGFSFKEGLPDVRNSKVADLVHELQAYSASTDVYDPWVDPAEASAEYGITPLRNEPATGAYDAIVLAVAHPEFKQWGATRIHSFGKREHVLFDVKAMLAKGESDGRL